MTSTSDFRIEIINEQYKTLREEVHLRIKQHTQLVTFKLVSLGAVFAYITKSYIDYKTTDSSVELFSNYFIWIVPFIAIVFDFMIAGNLRALYNIGPYIKKFIEPFFKEFTSADIKFWEEKVASNKSKYAGYTVVDLIVIWIVSFMSLFVVYLFRIKLGLLLIDYIIFILLVIINIIAITYLIRSIKMERKYL